MQPHTQQFPKLAAQALANPQVQAALAGLKTGFDQARQHAIGEITPEDWEHLRDRAREIKRHTLEHLDSYLALLAENVRRNGGSVHFAKDAQEATATVLEIAHRNGVKLVVKGKSMVSEEMALNRVLESAGVETVETDLGEYIIQLAGETPFHIVAPAIHKSKEEVAALFQRKLGALERADIPSLTRTARETLRQKFLQADMGISGVNFAVAETGTVCIVTNEGNGRMSTSLPRIHVAVMGMEKVVPALEDLGVFYRLLPRAATGQRATSYFTLVSGPRRAADEDGPEQFHLVILDNGRGRLLADPDLREALYCIRCAACLNICPVYRKVGGHAYGWVYPGPIGAVVTPVMVGLPKARDLPFASTLCGACRDVCPLKIDIPRMLLTLRHRVAEGPPAQRKASWYEGLGFRLWGRVMASEQAMARARRVALFVQRPFARGGHIRRLHLPPLSRWTRKRDLPALPERSFHEIWEKDLRTSPPVVPLSQRARGTGE
ncbi:MAG: iron-sulfur cluster-binding protein [Chloroflexi bacterium]|nr:iron-sulfur cluster-binding protein [Chloroflexota bacterium]